MGIPVAMPLRRTHQTLIRYVETLAVLVPLGVVLSAVGGWLLARRALRPVDRMSQSALRISAEDLSRRIRGIGGSAGLAGRVRTPGRITIGRTRRFLNKRTESPA